VVMALQYTIQLNCRDNEEAAAQYSELAGILGIKEENNVKTSMKFAAAIKRLMKKIGSPRSFKEAGVTKEDFDAGLEKLVEFAMMDTSLTMNPRNTDSQEIRKLYKYMFNGKSINF
jgi:1-propanol dehydrogenase